MEYVGGGSVKDIVNLFINKNIYFIVSEKRRSAIVRSVHCNYIARITERHRLSAQQTQNS